MSKGLEALERLGEMTLASEYGDEPKVKGLVLYDIIKEELKECEMEHTLRIRLENINYELVREKQENEKKLKALEIIKVVCNNFPVTICEMIFKSKISKEEYDLLLKEVLL